ncbi:MAG: hypothetical protein MJ231_05970 [bacterium]|nr:hypothetical protein [bacterium]
MDYMNIEASIRFLQAENNTANVQTGDVGLYIIFFIISFALLIGSLLLIYRLKSNTAYQDKSSVKSFSKALVFPFIIVAVIIVFIGAVSIFTLNNIGAAIAENEIVGPNTINAYVNEDGSVNIEESNIYSKNGLDLKFDGLQTELCDSSLNLGSSI